MKPIRQPAVAGLFYPADPLELRTQVQEYLANAEHRDLRPKAIVAPHAGYIYSGPIAGSAYAQIAPIADLVRRVVLLGPAHRMAFRGLAYSSAGRFRTPLGEVRVDQAALEAIADLPQVHELEGPFDGEHCLEVQLPFLQTVLRDFKVVPLLVSEATPGQVAEVLERLWGGDETLVVISSDLSHYLDYATARTIDVETSAAIEGLRPEAIGHHQACGRTPLGGLLLEAQRHGLHAVTLDLRSSGDTAGPRTQVVGYGAYCFS
jgi:MEMO1 family protein